MSTHTLQIEIPHQAFLADQGWVLRAVEQAKKQIIEDALLQIIDREFPVVVELHTEWWDEPNKHNRCLRLHCRLTEVLRREVVYSEPFVFTNHLGSIEWKCPWCATINPIEATYCGEKHEHAVGCGKPREKTRQEIYA